MTNFKDIFRARRTTALAVAAVGTCLLLAVAAHATVRELTDGGEFNAPACSDGSCQVMTRSTAYQVKNGTKTNPFRVPRTGSVVALSLYLPKVSNNRPTFVYRYFADAFGGAPTAQVSILRSAPRRGVRHRYKLVAQSERINVKPYLGQSASFALAKPVPVRRGDIVAITTDTWLPAFRVSPQDSSSAWRASRPKGKCDAGDNAVNYKAPRMHKKIGQIKQYACEYVGSRVLYRATVVDTPKS